MSGIQARAKKDICYETVHEVRRVKLRWWYWMPPDLPEYEGEELVPSVPLWHPDLMGGA
ncbi:hypothetical protein BC835DRAFT_1392076 [Cytidiella melzeri]|nr:hypothetical protein BC835DRAFT_1392076 [Cytidiella melzeri]